MISLGSCVSNSGLEPGSLSKVSGSQLRMGKLLTLFTPSDSPHPPSPPRKQCVLKPGPSCFSLQDRRKSLWPMGSGLICLPLREGPGTGRLGSSALGLRPSSSSYSLDKL